MEEILKEFNEAQEILRQQLKDREKHKQQPKPEIEDGDESKDTDQKSLEPVQQLIKELGELLGFINENKECVDVVLEEELKI